MFGVVEAFGLGLVADGEPDRLVDEKPEDERAEEDVAAGPEQALRLDQDLVDASHGRPDAEQADEERAEGTTHAVDTDDVE